MRSSWQAFLGAIVWDLITWDHGLPTSSSHALIGGYAGAAVAKAGTGVLILSGWTKTLMFIVLAPAIGLLLGVTLMVSTTGSPQASRRYALTSGSVGCITRPAFLRCSPWYSACARTFQPTSGCSRAYPLRR